MTTNRLDTINNAQSVQGVKLLASKVMPDGAMALAIEHAGEIIVTRMYLTELLGFLHSNHLNDTEHTRLIGANRTAPKFKMEIAMKDYYIVSKKQYEQGLWAQAIPEYKASLAIEDKT